MKNVIDYHKEMLKTLQIIRKLDEKPLLLLHVCCAPCAAYPIQLLAKYFRIRIAFYNPNIYPQAEFEKRYDALRKYVIAFLSKYPDAGYDIKLFTDVARFDASDSRLFISKTSDYADEKEGGARCSICFKMRLYFAIKTASNEKIPYVMTTLTSSRHKNAELINEIAFQIQKEFPDVTYIASDFKKDSGEEKSREICREFGIYRQNYCGCVYSFQQRFPA